MPPFHVHGALLGAVLLVLVWSGIGPYDRYTWFLEVAPVLISLPLLGVTYFRFRLTTLVYALIAAHAVILLVGGHYTYARVPLFDWLRDAFGLERNHYDRLGHFAQGFVPAMIAREILLRTTPLKRGRMLFFLVGCVCLAISAAYEVIEWLAAELTGDAAADFLGTQGDPWDTQKDMALAGIGAVTAQLALRRAHDRALVRLGTWR
jgi:putative membrane protein